jgi:hypothetical protein
MKLRTNAISNIGECVMCAWNGAWLWNRALKVLEFGKKKKKEKSAKSKIMYRACWVSERVSLKHHPW